MGTCDTGDKNGNLWRNQKQASNEQAMHQLAFYLRIANSLILAQDTLTSSCERHLRSSSPLAPPLDCPWWPVSVNGSPICPAIGRENFLLLGAHGPTSTHMHTFSCHLGGENTPQIAKHHVNIKYREWYKAREAVYGVNMHWLIQLGGKWLHVMIQGWKTLK